MRGFGHGAGFLGRGFALWRTRPGLMLLGMVPALIVFALLVAAFVALVLHVGDLARLVTPFADDWAEGVRDVVRLLLALALVAGALLLFVSLFVGLTLAVGDPFYERIWRETEAMLGGPVPEHGLGFLRSVGDGLTLVAIGLMTSVVVLLSGFVPLLGPVLAAVLGVVLSGRLLARELVARPLEARGHDRVAQRAMLAPYRSTMLGFGVVTQLCFLVPLGGVIAMPAAVAGSTMLAREVLDAAPPLGG